MNHIEIEELLKVGAHFGHPTSKWNPKFAPYIVTKKNGVHIIDLNETNRCLNNAVEELIKIVKSNGNVLFVGTKKQAKDVVQQAADRCGMYYIVERWLGGTLTNFGTIKRSIRRLFLLDKESSDLYKNLTKKEQHMLDREKLKLADLHRGIKDMKHLPAALFFVDGIQERIAISEAKILGIPVFGIVDSNTDPTHIDYPIPANDDSLKTIQLLVDFVSNKIIEALGGTVETPSSSEESSVSKDEESNDGLVEATEKVKEE